MIISLERSKGWGYINEKEVSVDGW